MQRFYGMQLFARHGRVHYAAIQLHRINSVHSNDSLDRHEQFDLGRFFDAAVHRNFCC